MINEESRRLTKGLFRLGGVKQNQKLISFDQYLLCVCAFASLTLPELHQFVFDLYDEDRSGEAQATFFFFAGSFINALMLLLLTC